MWHLLLRFLRVLPVSVVLLLLVLSGSLFAQPASLTLRALFEQALEEDPGLRQARVRLAQARLESDSRWNRFLPALEVGTSLTRRTSGGPEGEPWSGSLSASAALTVPRGVEATGAIVSVAERSAALELLRLEAELLRSVREEYYGALLARERLRIALRNGELEEQRLDQVEALFDQGRASELDLLEARYQALRRRPEIIERREALLGALNRLRVRLGVDTDAEVLLAESEELTALTDALVEGHYEPPGTPEVIEAAPRLRAALLELQEQEARRSLSLRERNLPQLSASYSYAPSVAPPFDATGWSEAGTWETGTLSLRLSLPLTPFVPGSRESNALEAREREALIAEIDLARREREILSRAEELNALLGFSVQKIAVLIESVRVARTLYDRTQEAFESGGLELLDVENAQGSLESAELELLGERYNTVLRLAELEALAGRNSLSEINDADSR